MAGVTSDEGKKMLQQGDVSARLPAQDLERARAFRGVVPPELD
jgi:hypothetical protein